MDPNGNTILVTGGSAGIGRELARAFNALGNTVIVTGRRTEALAETIADRDNMHAMALDMTDPAAIAAFATVVTNLLGPIRLTLPLLAQLMKQRSAAVVTVSSGLAFVPLAVTPT